MRNSRAPRRLCCRPQYNQRRQQKNNQRLVHLYVKRVVWSPSNINALVALSAAAASPASSPISKGPTVMTRGTESTSSISPNSTMPTSSQITICWRRPREWRSLLGS